jgi:ankyrin repeat protein
MDIVNDADVASGLDKPGAGLPAGIVDRATSGTPAGIKSSPPTLPTATKTGPEAEDRSPSGGKSDSEAETVVLPAHGLSPTKSRKAIKLEDKFREGDPLDEIDVDDAMKDGENAELPSEGATSNLGKRKRSKHGNVNTRQETRNGNSSGLSSVPTSPLATTRSSLSKRAESESDISKSPSPGASRGAKAKSTRRDSPQDSDNEAPSADDKEKHRTRRRRSSGLEVAGQQNQQNVDPQSTSHAENNSRNPTRSTSPRLPAHRRSASSNSAVNGLSHKKRKLPAPLRATRDRHSIEEESDDDSSVGESPHPRRSRTRNLATPPTGDSSVAKMPPHKKRNPFGRTALADACEDGDITKARRLLQEKPEDLDVADAAGNTPLQCASLNGHEDVVKMLIDAGCNIHCVNDRKDSPLLDAVENGHLEVVKLLLAAGVNPKIRNEEGEEPINKIDESGEDAEAIRQAIRQALIRARANVGHTQPSLPVQSPQTESYSSRSRRTQSHGRSTKTGEHQLYTSYNVNSLRSAAARGDLQTVGNILQVIVTPGFDDPESLVAAARGGHEEVLQILLGFGNADPDPQPLEHKDWEHATPMLAAIGSDNIKVIELLLAKVDDDRFDPTKRYNGSTYYEIAKQRMGPLWEEEERILKDAYEKYKSRSNARPSSTNQQGSTRGHQKKLSDSDGRSSGGKSRPQVGSGTPQSLKREQKGPIATSSAPIKRGPGRPRKEGNEPPPTLDRERSSSATHKEKSQPRRPESESMAAQADIEPSKPRRKLISGKDLKGEREKQRRASVASIPAASEMTEGHPSESSQVNPSTSKTAPPRLINNASDPDIAVEKSLDRARSIKRDDSKDRVTAIRGESPAKRPRQSSTPPSDLHDSSSLKPADHGFSNKRRRLEAEGKNASRAEGRWSSSPDRRSTSGPSGLSNETPAQKDQMRDSKHLQNAGTVKNLESQSSRQSTTNPQKPSSTDDAKTLRLEKDLRDQPKNDSDDKQTQGEGTAGGTHKVAQPIEPPEVVQKIKQEERDAEEELERQRLEDLRLELEAKEKLAREEAAKRQQEREEELRRKEQERREELRRADEERRRLYEEQLRLQREEQLRLQREDQERRKAAQLEEARAERRRIQQEREAARLAKLPPLLRWFDGYLQPTTPEFASEFRVMQGVRYDTIKPEATGSTDGREQWLLNTQVALLLGEKDLQLSRCKFIELKIL